MARAAFIIDDMFEDKEFQVPYDRIREAGHEALIVGLDRSKVLTALHGTKTTTHRAVDEISAEEFDAVVIPGGYSPDKIRLSERIAAGHGVQPAARYRPSSSSTAS